jgi:hypothetical protein
MIGANLSKDELVPTTLSYIFPDALVAQKRAALFHQILRESGIESHVAGGTTSRDVFSVEGSELSRIHIGRREMRHQWFMSWTPNIALLVRS